jgi:hypothetical protein
MMKQANKLFTVAVLLLMGISVTLAQNPAKPSKHPVQPNAAATPVTGSAGLPARGGIARGAGQRSGYGIEAYRGIGEQGAANGLAGIFHGSVTTFTLQGESGNLTVIGTFAQAIVADEMKGNRFSIKTSAPSVKVSWQVTGVRQDAFANKNRISVEEDNPEAERGYYLHPAEHGKSEEKNIVIVQYPEIMRESKEAREKAQKEKLQ